jgi:hypothetical protein
MPDFKGPGQWRSQAVKAQGTAGSSAAKPAEQAAGAKKSAASAPAKGKGKS